MINIHRKLKEGKFKTKMLLQVHDELVFDAYKEELDAVEKLIKSEMEQAFVLSVPLVVDMGKEEIGWRHINLKISYKNGLIKTNQARSLRLQFY